VDIDTAAMQAKGLTPVDVVNAISAQNLILPSGTAKIGNLQYQVSMNGSPDTIAEINGLPIKPQTGATTYIRDVAHVRDGCSPQTNVVRKDGLRTLITVMRNGGASTLDIVNNMKETLKRVKPRSPGWRRYQALFDQSLFVRASISGVVRGADCCLP
jgi:multidrug efflux pump subunit AcrB